MHTSDHQPQNGGKNKTPLPADLPDIDREATDAGAGNAGQPSPKHPPMEIRRDLAERGIAADPDPDDPVSP